MKPGWTGVHGTLYVKANYQLLIDNILDLTHVVFVHKTTLAGGGVAETPLEVEVKDDVVRAQRLMRNVDTAPIYKAARNLHGKIDRWQFLEFRPPIYARITLGASSMARTGASSSKGSRGIGSVGTNSAGSWYAAFGTQAPSSTSNGCVAALLSTTGSA